MEKIICEHGSWTYKDGYYICDFCGKMVSESDMIELPEKSEEE